VGRTGGGALTLTLTLILAVVAGQGRHVVRLIRF
jgi:hypothetical protein